MEMRKIPPEVRVVVVGPLPDHHLEVFKELVRRAALRKLSPSIHKFDDVFIHSGLSAK